MGAIELSVALLTKEAFAPFGEIIETDGAEHFAINNGTTERFHALATADVEAEGGKAIISMFEGQPFNTPINISMMERHPLGSQAFVPLSGAPYIVVVAADNGNGKPAHPQAFLARADQGVNYGRNVWHHPLISLEKVSRFLIVDRAGDGENLEEVAFSEPQYVIANLPPLNR